MEVELSSGVIADLFPTIGSERGVVVVPDLEGRSPLFAEMAANLAGAHAWNTIVVDPLDGYALGLHGRPDPALTDPSLTDPSLTGPSIDRGAILSRLDDDQVVADLVDAANRLETEPVALIGFGSGGMYAVKAAASHRFDRVVSFYGPIRLPSAWRGRDQRDPLVLLSHVERPGDILAIVGEDDPYTPTADVDELIGLGVRVARYERLGSGFAHRAEMIKARPGEAADAWSQAVSHLAVEPAR